MTAQCYVCPCPPVAQCPGCQRWFCERHSDHGACVKCMAQEFVEYLRADQRAAIPAAVAGDRGARLGISDSMAEELIIGGEE